MTDFNRIRRAGMLIPCTNTLIDIEFNRFLPQQYQLFTARLQMGPMSEAGWKMQDADIDYQARLLGTARMELMILAQTSASFFDPSYDADVTRRMRAASGVPAYAAGNLIGQAAKAMGAKKVAFISPYGDVLTQLGCQYYEKSHGIDVVAARAYGQATTADAVATISQQAAEIAIAATLASEPDLIVVAGGNFATLHLIDQWERKFKKPILTTNQCTMWMILKSFGATQEMSFGGELLRRYVRSAAAPPPTAMAQG